MKTGEYYMNKKSLITILAILFIPIIAFFCLTFNRENSAIAQAQNKPQIIKFSSTMCLECKEVEKVFKELIPQHKDEFVYTEIIVDGRNDMKNSLIKKYNVTLVPTIIMLNSDGTQYMRLETSVPKEKMEEYIKGLK
jgi:thiol:disulfide interchange protein